MFLIRLDWSPLRARAPWKFPVWLLPPPPGGCLSDSHVCWNLSSIPCSSKQFPVSLAVSISGGLTDTEAVSSTFSHPGGASLTKREI